MRNFLKLFPAYALIMLLFLLSFLFWNIYYLNLPLKTVIQSPVNILIVIGAVICWTAFFIQNRNVFPSMFDDKKWGATSALLFVLMALLILRML